MNTYTIALKHCYVVMVCTCIHGPSGRTATELIDIYVKKNRR